MIAIKIFYKFIEDTMCVQNKHSEWQIVQTLIKLFPWEQFDQGLYCLLRHVL